MKTILELDRKNYGSDWKVYTRNAVRAIIIHDGRIALAKSMKEGFYKFPGGGIEKGESHTDALIRETLEETGLKIIPSSIKEFGMSREARASKFTENEVFEQNSYYYFADIEDSIHSLNLDGYEAELGFCLEWADISKAYEANLALSKVCGFEFLQRESAILKMIADSLQQ